MARRQPVKVLGVFRIACFVVAAVAGVAGIVMLVAPQDTESYFSWPIGPPPLAALVGGFYVASAVTFALLGARPDWPAARGVCFGILAFTLPTLAATAYHRDLFDWDRWQAVAWVALFVGSPIAFSSFLFLQRGQGVREGTRLPSRARAGLGLLGGVYGALAVGLLVSPARLHRSSPFALPGLSGRFIGSWCAFLAVLALFAMWRNHAREAAVPLLGLLLWPFDALVAALRTFDELQPSSRRLTYLLVVAGLAGVAALILVAQARAVEPRSASRR